MENFRAGIIYGFDKPFSENIFGLKEKRKIIRLYNLNLEKIPEGIVRRVSSVNSDECRRLLRTIDPDIVLVNGTRIISKETLTSCKASFINIHDGITPVFRGVHGGYWAIARQRPELFGTTIHYVDKGIDTGEILDQVFIKPLPNDNFVTYPYLQHAEALPVLEKMLKQLLNGNNIDTKQPVTKESSLCHHPTLFEWLRFLKYTKVLF
ncbi:MAG: formyl transferase [Bacteroidia bacterium]|nr:formyl transferase [Bacteroidia bacterium]